MDRTRGFTRSAHGTRSGAQSVLRPWRWWSEMKQIAQSAEEGRPVGWIGQTSGCIWMPCIRTKRRGDLRCWAGLGSDALQGDGTGAQAMTPSKKSTRTGQVWVRSGTGKASSSGEGASYGDSGDSGDCCALLRNCGRDRGAGSGLGGARHGTASGHGGRRRLRVQAPTRRASRTVRWARARLEITKPNPAMAKVALPRGPDRRAARLGPIQL